MSATTNPTMNSNQAARMQAAEATAATFLLVPFESAVDRQDSLDEVRGLLLAAIEPAVRAGRDDLAHQVLALLHKAEG